MTRHLLKARRSQGSRLHRGPDGIWYAYAQWESAGARRRAFEGAVDIAARDRMGGAIAETYPELILEPVDRSKTVVDRSVALQELAVQRQKKLMAIVLPLIVVCLGAIGYLLTKL